jgi:hypothetical protein
VKRACAAALVLALSLVACTGRKEPSPEHTDQVLSPAPVPSAKLAGGGGECVTLGARGNLVAGSTLVGALSSHTPTRLPEGFGLPVGWSGEESVGGVWTDEECGQIHLQIFLGAAAEEADRPDGQWAFLGRGRCFFAGPGYEPCVDYHAQSDGDAISLSLFGLSEEEVEQVLAAISPA